MTTQVASRAARASRPAVSADAPILAAKITAPGLPDWVVPRPRITKLIARGRRWCPLTVITAPAGAGKTMARDVFHSMPHREAWNEPQPYLVCAAVALSVGAPETSAAALDAAEGILGRLPAGQEAESRLAAALIRLAASRRAGDLVAAVAAADRAQVLLSMISPAKLARHPDIKVHVLSGRGAVELWSGHLDEAARTLESAMAAAAPGAVDMRAGCLGHLALVEAMRGRLGRAVTAAVQAAAAFEAGEPQPRVPPPIPAALVALAWVHLDRYELSEARSRLKQADAALSANPDTLIGAVAWLVAAGEGLAGGRAAAAAQIIGREGQGGLSRRGSTTG